LKKQVFVKNFQQIFQENFKKPFTFPKKCVIIRLATENSDQNRKNIIESEITIVQVREHFKRGVSEIAILHLLNERDMYGYELLREIGKRSQNKFVLKYSSLYPVLYRLIDKGIISDTQKLVGKRRTRVYYHLTEMGKEYYEELKSEYYYITEGFNYLMNYQENDNENQ